MIREQGEPPLGVWLGGKPVGHIRTRPTRVELTIVKNKEASRENFTFEEYGGKEHAEQAAMARQYYLSEDMGLMRNKYRWYVDTVGRHVEMQLTHHKTMLLDGDDLQLAVARVWYACPVGKMNWTARARQGTAYLNFAKALTGWDEIKHADGNKLNYRRANLIHAPPTSGPRTPHTMRNTVGIYFFRHPATGYTYWTSNGKDDNGKRIVKYFSIAEHGDEGARQLAVAARASKE